MATKDLFYNVCTTKPHIHYPQSKSVRRLLISFQISNPLQHSTIPILFNFQVIRYDVWVISLVKRSSSEWRKWQLWTIQLHIALSSNVWWPFPVSQWDNRRRSETKWFECSRTINLWKYILYLISARNSSIVVKSNSRNKNISRIFMMKIMTCFSLSILLPLSPSSFLSLRV